jgi:hypothetical protein
MECAPGHPHDADMSRFEFVFSLFGILLGFSLVEVLGGFVRTMKLRRHIRLGWLVPLLGLYVMLDITSFWDNAWEVRDLIPANAGILFYGLFLFGAYYFAASMVFPDKPGEWPDLDVYYFLHKRQILGAIAIVNLIVLANLILVNPAARLTPVGLVIQTAYFGLLALAWWSKRPRVGVAALAGLAGIYLVNGVLILGLSLARLVLNGP